MADASGFKCMHHPDVVLGHDLQCEACIEAGFALRITSHRVGRNRYVQTITVPPAPAVYDPTEDYEERD